MHKWYKYRTLTFLRPSCGLRKTLYCSSGEISECSGRMFSL